MTADREASTEELKADYERQFRRAGLPSLISDLSGQEDVFTRATPFLLLVLMFEPLSVLDSDWTWWQNLLAVVGGAAFLWFALSLLSRLRFGSWSGLPQSVGTVELVAFIALPALVPLVVGGHFFWALGTIVLNLVLLAVAYLVIANGFIATAWATIRRSRDELSSSVRKLALALPVLLVFSIVLFVNSDMWMIFDHMHGSAMIGLLILFGGLIVTFVSLRVPPQVKILEHNLELGGEDNPRLTRSQHRNVTFMFIVSQLFQVIVVSGGVAIFFLIFSVLTVTSDVLDSWKIAGAEWVLDLAVGPTAFALSSTHLRVSLAIGTFTGLYYAISIMTNDSYRDEFLEGMTDELGPVFETRAKYLALID